MSKLIRKSKKGFTLIELMIVVAIIGILAAIAIPNFLRFQLKSKSSEGKVNIAAIRTAEESYLAEFGSYVDGTASPTMADPGAQKVTWADNGGFGTLGWSPEGRVFFQYEVNASGSAYTITAQADIDADDTNQRWGYVKPVTGTTAGVNPASMTGECTANGIANNQLSTVGPCATTHGQSVF